MNADPSSEDHSTTQGLAGALAKNAEATEAVQEVADELSVVHAVLTQKVASIAGDGEAASAVERTAVLEQKLTETAEKMAEVNQALSDQHASLEHLNRAK